MSDTNLSLRWYKVILQVIEDLQLDDKELDSLSLKLSENRDYSPEPVMEIIHSNLSPQNFELFKKNYNERMTPEAITFLKNPDLFNIITEQELDKKIVREFEARKSIFLITLGGILLENSEPTSKNLLVHDKSGAGKDFLVKAVLEILPKEFVVKRKRISEKVFSYWHNSKFEPEWTWDGKIFYNEDVSNSVINSDVFKVMLSSDGINQSTILINQIPCDIVTKGKPVVILTIAEAQLINENLRRLPILGIDTSTEQTREILKRKAQFHMMGIRPEYDEKIIEALKYLKRVKVRVPFADKLTNVLSPENIIIRTNYDKLIDYIKFSTAIHQFQREKDSEDYIIAQKEDYDIARVVIVKTISNIFSIPLTKNQESILKIFRENPLLWFSVSDIESKVTLSNKWLRIELNNLTNFGFLTKDKEDREDSKKPVMIFKLLEVEKLVIPTWEDVQNSTIDKSVTNDTINTNDTIDGTIVSNLSIVQDFRGSNPQKHIQIDKKGVCSACCLPDRWLIIQDSEGKEFCDRCAKDEPTA